MKNIIVPIINRLNDIENAPRMAKELIYADNTDISVLAKVIVSALYDYSDSNTLKGMTTEIADKLLDLLDSVMWAFAEKCNDGCIPNYILKKCDDLHNAVYDDLHDDLHDD